MTKLVHNTFGDEKILKNGEGEYIQWKFIKKLYEKEQQEGLRLSTKLTSRYIYYTNEKINVRLATQLLSNSKGDILLYLSKEDPKFSECVATAEFYYMINNAFDVSRKLYSNNPYNNAISSKTFEEYKKLTYTFINYATLGQARFSLRQNTFCPI